MEDFKLLKRLPYPGIPISKSETEKSKQLNILVGEYSIDVPASELEIKMGDSRFTSLINYVSLEYLKPVKLTSFILSDTILEDKELDF